MPEQDPDVGQNARHSCNRALGARSTRRPRSSHARRATRYACAISLRLTSVPKQDPDVRQNARHSCIRALGARFRRWLHAVMNCFARSTMCCCSTSSLTRSPSPGYRRQPFALPRQIDFSDLTPFSAPVITTRVRSCRLSCAESLNCWSAFPCNPKPCLQLALALVAADMSHIHRAHSTEFDLYHLLPSSFQSAFLSTLKSAALSFDSSQFPLTRSRLRSAHRQHTRHDYTLYSSP